MNDSEMGPVIIGKLMNIGGMLERKANQLLLPYDLNYRQFSILFEIDKAGKVNQTSMVNRLVLEKAHVSKVVKKLREAGLVDMTVSPDDRRSTWLSITPGGHKLVSQCQTLFREWNGAWIEDIDKDRLVLIRDSLSVLQEVFHKKTGALHE